MVVGSGAAGVPAALLPELLPRDGAPRRPPLLAVLGLLLIPELPRNPAGMNRHQTEDLLLGFVFGTVLIAITVLLTLWLHTWI